jgi:hypothetical protein
MLKDPLMNWPTGAFPYDALAAAKIMPESRMSQVRDAWCELAEQGLWTDEPRSAWEELRTVPKRLWVDLFLYPVTVNEIILSVTNAGEQQEAELLTKEIDGMLKRDLDELQILVRELESSEGNRGQS